MAEPNFKNRTLYHGDNLDFLRGMNSETVHLVATDPPFNKNRDFHATPDSLAAGAKFQDRWSWTRDVHEEWTDSIIDDWPAAWEVIIAARAAYGDDMGAFLCWLGVRLMEMHRVLRPDGSLYLQCDTTASHYIKAMLDAIFGWENFRNDIVWKRTSAHSDASRWGSVHDVLLYYSKSDRRIWNEIYMDYDDGYKKRFRNQDAGGRLWTDGDITAKGLSGGGYTYTYKGAKSLWRVPLETMERLDKENRLHFTRTGGIRIKRYLDELPGIPAQDVITDIFPINSQAKERTGYPTQKPLALYRRIIEASSNEDDIVLDPFCGCATTPVAAEQLKREWVGMDIWDGAKEIVLKRLRDEWLVTPEEGENMMFPHIVHIETTPPARTDDNEIAAPVLRLKIQRPELPWEKITHKGMMNILASAQQNMFGVICAGCGRDLEREFMQLDHILPKAEGGANHILNRILLCGPCNRRKRNYLTLAGLHRENKKKAVGWMKDEKEAKRAQAKARERAEWVRDYFHTQECQDLIAGDSDTL